MKIQTSADLLSPNPSVNKYDAIIKGFKSALLSKDLQQVKSVGSEVLKTMGDFNILSEKGLPPLICVVHKKNNLDKLEKIKYLLENGAHPNFADMYGNTFFHHLFFQQVLDFETTDKIMSLLMDYGFINQANEEGDLPQHFLFKSKNHQSPLPIIDLLIAKGIDLEARGAKGNTLLHYVTRNGNAAEVAGVLKYKINVDPINDAKNTPLHLASFYGDMNMVRLFVHHGADVNLPGQDCETPLFNAFKKGHTLIFKHLLKHGASLVALDEKGEDLFVKTISPKPELQVFYEKQKYDRSFPQNSKKTQKSRL